MRQLQELLDTYFDLRKALDAVVDELVADHDVSLLSSRRGTHVLSGIQKIVENLGAEFEVRERVCEKYPFAVYVEHEGREFFQLYKSKEEIEEGK